MTAAQVWRPFSFEQFEPLSPPERGYLIAEAFADDQQGLTTMAQHEPRPFAAARAALPDGQWHRLLIKAGFALVLALIFGWLLANRLADIPLSQTRSALSGVTPMQWVTATFATIISFWAVGHYDGVIHRYLATGIAPVTARRAGATAIAVGQTLGLGVVTGAILRWRMLPGQSLWQATKITSLVALFFLAGWALVTAVVLVALPLAPYKPVAVGLLILLPCVILVCTLHPRRHRWHLPNMFVVSRLLALTAVDTLTAALALWVLCPPDLALPFATLLPAFLIAFGAGILSGTPGGVGTFEIAFLALLPHVPEAPLLAAVLAWRVVYFAAPALVGAAVAIRGPLGKAAPTPLTVHPTLVQTARRAETGLFAQGHLSLCAAGHDQAWLTGRTPHCLVGMLDPMLSRASHDSDLGCNKLAITALIDRAGMESRLPVIYKCTARTAVAARHLGLSLHPIAREAWLDPRAFTLGTPSRAGLRRKLRHADNAAITISLGPHDRAQLCRIAKDWSAAHGGERGFSMGRFDASYLAGQRVYVACMGSKPIALASFHAGKTEWTLDLMRQTLCAPDGTMQALIVRAIADAATLNLSRLSLAAVPLAALCSAPKGRIAGLIHRLSGGNQAGLARFKSAFVPEWQTLYIAAPHKPALALAASEIAREVHFPAPLPVPVASSS